MSSHRGSRVWLGPDRLPSDRQTLALAGVVLLSVLLFIITPGMALTSVLGLSAAFAVAVPSRRWLLSSAAHATPVWFVAGCGCLAYLGLSVAWSDDPILTIKAAVIFGYLLVAGLILQRRFSIDLPRSLQTLALAFAAAFVIALFFLLIEELTGHSVKKAVEWPFVAIRWQNGWPAIDPGREVRISPLRIKWGMSPLMFLLWPVLMLCVERFRKPAALGMQAILLCGCTYLIVLSDHKTSIVAMAAAVVAFAVAWKWQTMIRWILVTIWLAGFVAVIPVTSYLHTFELERVERLGPTLAARVVLWDATAREFNHRPWFGIGAGATKLVHTSKTSVEAVPIKGKLFGLIGTAPHAHNVFLQSLYELGVAGSCLFALFGLALLWQVGAAPRSMQPFLLASATTVIVTASASFGLFEPWFMGAFGIAMFGNSLAVAYARDVEGRA